MARPKGAAREKGKVLVSVGGWTEQHRIWAREYAKAVGRGEPPVPVNGPRPPDLGDRIGRYAADAAANAPAKEPIACWGGCGRELPNGYRPAANGWEQRSIRLGGGPDIETYCPECFEQLGGFHGPPEGMGMGAKEITTGRAAVLDCDDTARYPRLRDDHLTVACHDCETTLLADQYAAEAAADPEGLPPVAAGSITLPGGRTMRYCGRCIGTHVIKRDDHTAGGGDRRADKPVGGGE